jgi:hypothetical protein
MAKSTRQKTDRNKRRAPALNHPPSNEMAEAMRLLHPDIKTIFEMLPPAGKPAFLQDLARLAGAQVLYFHALFGRGEIDVEKWQKWTSAGTKEAKELVRASRDLFGPLANLGDEIKVTFVEGKKHINRLPDGRIELTDGPEEEPPADP